MKSPLAFAVPATLLFFLLLDTGLRILPAELLSFRAQEEVSDEMHSPNFGAFIPNSRYSSERTMGDLAYMRNQAASFRNETFSADGCGNRNPQTALDRPRTDVLLLGTSFTAGTGIDEEKTLTSRLEAISGLEVYNAAGVGAAKLDVGWVRSLGRRVHLAGGTVVLEYNEKFPMQFVWSSAALSACEGMKPEVAESFVDNLAARFRRMSPVQRLGHRFLRALSDDRLFVNSQRHLVRSFELKNGETMLFYGADIEKTFNKDELTPTVAQLKLFKDQLAADGIKLLVMLLPLKYTVYRPQLKTSDARPDDTTYLEFLQTRLESSGVAVLNMTKSLRNAAAEALQSNRYVYWLDDTHWNPDGIELTARALGKRLNSPH